MSDPPPVVLVTGSRGFVGRNLMRAGVGGGRLVPDREDDERLDLTDYDQVSRLVGAVQPTSIVNLAGLSDPRAERPLSAFLQGNVAISANVLEAAAANGAERVVLAGSRHADAPNRSPYAFSKSLLVPLARFARERLGVHASVARLCNTAGTEQSSRYLFGTLAQQFREVHLGERTEVHVGDVDAALDVVDVRDASTALLHIATRSFESVEISVATGHTTRVRDVIDLFKQHSRLDPPIVSAQDRVRPRDAQSRTVDPSPELVDAGWSPSYRLDDTVRWIIEQDVLVDRNAAAPTRR